MGFTDSVPFSSKRAQSDKPTWYHYDDDDDDEADDDDDDDNDDEEYLANILAPLWELDGHRQKCKTYLRGKFSSNNLCLGSNFVDQMDHHTHQHKGFCKSHLCKAHGY